MGIATALMCALAGGAVWCLLSLYSRQDLGAMVFPVAVCIVWALRSHGYAGRWHAAVLAALCIALATFYTFALKAVAQVAGMFGLSMRSTLRKIDPATVIELAWVNLRGWNLIMVSLAILLAIAWMLRAATPCNRGVHLQ